MYARSPPGVASFDTPGAGLRLGPLHFLFVEPTSTSMFEDCDFTRSHGTDEHVREYVREHVREHLRRFSSSAPWQWCVG